MLTTTTILLPLTASLLSLATAKNTVVKVGATGLVFSPDSITGAVKGDTVEFQFYPKNHSVVSSTFDKPCVPQQNAIFSGFMPVNNGVGEQAFTVTLNDNKPVWVYCSQVDHCQGGMVMAINAPTTGNTLAAYKSASAKVANAESPNGGASGGNVGPVSASSSSNSTSSNSSSPSGGSSTMSGTGTTGAGTTSTSTSAATTSNAAILANGHVSSGVWGVLGGGLLMAFGMM